MDNESIAKKVLALCLQENPDDLQSFLEDIFLQGQITSQSIGGLLFRLSEEVVRKKDYKSSVLLLQQILNFEITHQQKVAVLSKLAHDSYFETYYALSSLNEAIPLEAYKKAKEYGEKALKLKNQILFDNYAKLKKVVSYSLFGNQPQYCENAIINSELITSIYQGWVMRVYHDKSVPLYTLERLRKNSVELIDVETIGVAHLTGTFWRFMALEDPKVSVVIFRDADSIINLREKILVDEWLASDKAFHVVRDWYGHIDSILAGLWGVKANLLNGIRQLIEKFVNENPKLNSYNIDQLFLEREIWPRIASFTLHHSSVYEVENSSWPQTVPLPISNHTTSDTFGVRSMHEYHLNQKTDWPYICDVISKSGDVIW